MDYQNFGKKNKIIRSNNKLSFYCSLQPIEISLFELRLKRIFFELEATKQKTYGVNLIIYKE
jgi:hypothetical protein